VLQDKFHPEIAAVATSIAQHASRAPSRTNVLLAVLEFVGNRLRSFEHDGLQSMHDELQARDRTLGRVVRFGGEQGIAEAIASDGSLLVRTPRGTTERVNAGEVFVVEDARRPG
jgi:biotin-(acetyl-CoA carboxylase) ligase